MHNKPKLTYPHFYSWYTGIFRYFSTIIITIVVLISCSVQQKQMPGYRFQIVDVQRRPILAATVSMRWSDETEPFSLTKTDNQGIVAGTFLIQGNPKGWSRELVVIATASQIDYDTDSTHDTSTTLTVILQEHQWVEQTILIPND